jgi:hypothetical protein
MNQNSYIKYLLTPLVLIVAIFCLDRLLTLEFVKKYTENRAEYYFYYVRELLIDSNIEESNSHPNTQTLMLLGTSHMGELSTETMEAIRPDLLPYNYSAPSAPFSFHNYIFHKALKKGVKPKYIIIEAFPYSASSESNYFALRYSYDWSFFLKNMKHFDLVDWDIFIRAQLFHTQRFPFRYSEIVKKVQNPLLFAFFETTKVNILKDYKLKRGGISNDLLFNTPPEKLKLESDVFYKDYLMTLQISKEQVYFFEDILKKAKEENIKVVVLETLVHPFLYEKMKDAPYKVGWDNLLNDLKLKYNFTHVKMQEHEDEIQCKNFVDPHHLSGKCFQKPTEILMNSLPL